MTQRERLIKLLDQNCGYVEEQRAELLADYLLANGVIVPPCKVGDTVYWYNMGGKIVEAKAKAIYFIVRHPEGFEYKVSFDDFGKTVFLTREEAEKALQKGAGNEQKDT